MTMSENTREILREMGLNAYEIDAYTSLLGGGKMTAMEISQETSVPYSKIYEVLNSLKTKGWIKSSESRPFQYYPIPPLEAMACGTPVISSTGGSLKEVVGDKAILMDTFDAGLWADNAKKVLGDTEYREKLVADGYKRVSKYKWENTARKTMEVYENCN